MKKVFTTWEQKRFNRARQKTEARLKDKRPARLVKSPYHKTNTSHNPFRRIATRKRVKIEAPKIFSIIKNPIEMLIFFKDIKKAVSGHHRVFVIMKGVSEATPDAIIYMLLKFEILKEKYPDFDFNGDFPEDEDCRKLLVTSGFFEKLFGKNTSINFQSEEVLKIESGQTSASTIAGNVIKFALEKLGNSRASPSSKSCYRNIIESMANTMNHAYDKDEIVRQWYVMALYKQSENRVSFAFLDSGKGIATTVKRRLMDRLKFSNDVDIVESALRGEFRTQTQLEQRGKGLPSIKESSDKKMTDNLVIISNKAYLDVKHSKSTRLAREFNGTLIVWDFIKEQNNE